MKKTLIGIGIGALLMVSGISYASTVSFGSNSTVSVGTGSTSSFGVPGGTAQGFSKFIRLSSTCGIQEDLYGMVRAAGKTWQRTDLSWPQVQATSSASYIWGPFDCAVNDAINDGINTLFILDYSPQWAAHSGCTVSGSQNCAPASASAFATYCGAAATHFNGRITYWEIWNEQNSGGSWGPAANTTEYITSLNACYSAIKAVNPSMVVLSGGLEPTPTVGGNISMQSFAAAYYTGGATFDIMAIHPYTFPWGLTKGTAADNGWQAMISVRQTMNANGDSAKPIWITEVGAPTCGPGIALNLDQDSPNFGQDYMTLIAQKQIIDQIIATSTSPFMNIGKIFWYTLRDGDSNNPSTRENCFGVLFSSRNAKPAWASIESSN